MSIRIPWYSFVADNDCFTKNEFLGSPWRKWLENLRHFEASRTRILVNDLTLEEAVASGGGAPAALASFTFDRTPQATVLMVRCMWELDTGWHGGVDLTWRVDSDDVGGGSSTTGEARYTDLRGRRGNIARGAAWQDVLPAAWPSPTELPLRPRYETGWIHHVPDSGATYPGTTVNILGRTNARIGNEPALYLRGVLIVGARGSDT